MNDESSPSLPPGWVRAPLEVVVEARKGKKPTNLFEGITNGSLPYVDIEAFEHGVFKRFGSMGDGVECAASDLLLVWDGARSGLTGKGVKGLVGSTIMVLTPKGIDSDYLFRFLQSKYHEMNSKVRGTGIPHLDPDIVWNLQIPIAPLPEQRRIVAKVEALFAESKTGCKALDKVPVLLRKFRQSVLAKAFKGELTQRDPNDEPAQKLLEKIRKERQKEGKAERKAPEQVQNEFYRLPETWCWTTVSELETFIGSGITPRGGKKVYVKDDIPFIRSQNVHPDGLHLEDVAHITSQMHAEMARTHVQANDVLLNITGASIGRSTYVPDDLGAANVNQHVCIIRTGWWIIPAYLSYFLNSTYGQEQIFATESGVTREGLNYKQIRSLRIPLAPLSEQKRVMNRIDETFSLASQIEINVRKARTMTDRIDRAVLVRAFRGELVAQDPNDEPASVLLERIKTTNKQRTNKQKTLN